MRAYDRIEPIGNIEQSYMLAMICCTIVNTLQSMFVKKGDRKPMQPTDFLPKWSRAFIETTKEKKEQTVEEQKGILHAIAAAFGVKPRKRTKGGYKPKRRK